MAPVRQKQEASAYRDYFRAWVLDKYGGKCVCCGESTAQFLTLDHVRDDGQREGIGGATGRKAAAALQEIGASALLRLAGWHHYRKLHEIYTKYGTLPNDLQLLCWNCQWGKRLGGGFCPHNPGRDLRLVNGVAPEVFSVSKIELPLDALFDKVNV